MDMSKFRVREKNGGDDAQLVEAETSDKAVEEYCRDNYDLILCVQEDFEIPPIEVFMPDGRMQTFSCEVDFKPFVLVKMM